MRYAMWASTDMDMPPPAPSWPIAKALPSQANTSPSRSPGCFPHKTARWRRLRKAELLPVPYFHVVFTLPAAIADIAYQNKAVIYDLLFKALADTLITIAADPKHLGARIGIISVLHTWGSALTHHPHVHIIVPDGGVSLDGARWLSCRPGFFLCGCSPGSFDDYS